MSVVTIYMAVYVGRRIGTKSNSLIYCWDREDGADTASGYKKQIAPASIGERWEFTENEAGGVIIRGEGAPKATGTWAPKNKITEWTAREIAHQQELAVRRTNKKMAARKNEYERALEPLRSMLNSLQFHEDRAAFIQKVTSDLWRR